MVKESVETAAALTPATFADYVEQSRPVLLKGLFTPPAPDDAWSATGVRERIGAKLLTVEVSASGEFYGGKQRDGSDVTRVEMTCGEFLDRMAGTGDHAPILAPSERYYAHSAPIEAYAPLDAELPVPDLIDQPRYGAVQRQVFISARGHTTPVHTDAWIDNLLAQIVGRKTVLLWSPDQAESLEIMPFGDVWARQSPLDPSDPDPERFPASAHALRAVLEAGDALYIPEGWIHHVTTDELSIGVSHKFNQQTAFEDALKIVAGRIMTIRPELRAQYLHLFRWPASMLSGPM